MKKIVARALQVFFRLLYHQFAWTYDFVAYIVSLGCWKDWVMTTLPYLEGPRIVELGFGPGHLQSELTRREVSVFGVDASPQMAKLTSLRMNKQGEQHHLSNAYAQQLPFPNESFDQIVATFPPEFILADSTYTEAFRVLAPGGSMVILLTAWITGNQWFERTAAWLFHTTGQSPDWEPRFLEPISRAGFQSQVTRHKRDSWEVLIVQAKKSNS